MPRYTMTEEATYYDTAHSVCSGDVHCHALCRLAVILLVSDQRRSSELPLATVTVAINASSL